MTATDRQTGVPRSDGSSYRGYVTGVMPTADESALEESADLGSSANGFDVDCSGFAPSHGAPVGGAIGFNGNGVIDPGTVRTDVN